MCVDETGCEVAIGVDGAVQISAGLGTAAGGSTGAHQLTIMFSEENFLFAPAFGFASFGGTITANGSTVQASANYDDTNALFSLATLILTTGPVSGLAFCAGGGPTVCPSVPSLGGPGPVLAPYSLTQVRTFNTTGTEFSGNFSLQMVPEPMSVVLFGSVLLVTMGALRRKVGQSV